MVLEATIDSLHIYPIKSLGHLSLESIEVNKSGFKYDREWMLTDMEGNFITQREFPILNKIQVLGIDDNDITLQFEGKTNTFHWNKNYDKIIDTQVWNSHCKGKIETVELNQYFTDLLQTNVFLVRMQKDSRMKSNEFMPSKTPIQFVDGYPIHIINQSSVDDLSNKCAEQIHALQFRPNIILSGIPPFIEDNIDFASINDSEWRFAKKCVRCIMTTLKPNESKFNKEPLRTLATYRKHKNQIEFGVYIYKTTFEDTILQKGNLKIQLKDL